MPGKKGKGAAASASAEPEDDDARVARERAETEERHARELATLRQQLEVASELYEGAQREHASLKSELDTRRSAQADVVATLKRQAKRNAEYVAALQLQQRRLDQERDSIEREVQSRVDREEEALEAARRELQDLRDRWEGKQAAVQQAEDVLAHNARLRGELATARDEVAALRALAWNRHRHEVVLSQLVPRIRPSLRPPPDASRPPSAGAGVPGPATAAATDGDGDGGGGDDDGAVGKDGSDAHSDATDAAAGDGGGGTSVEDETKEAAGLEGDPLVAAAPLPGSGDAALRALHDPERPAVATHLHARAARDVDDGTDTDADAGGGAAPSSGGVATHGVLARDAVDGEPAGATVGAPGGAEPPSVVRLLLEATRQFPDSAATLREAVVALHHMLVAAPRRADRLQREGGLLLVMRALRGTATAAAAAAVGVAGGGLGAAEDVGVEGRHTLASAEHAEEVQARLGEAGTLAMAAKLAGRMLDANPHALRAEATHEAVLLLLAALERYPRDVALAQAVAAVLMRIFVPLPPDPDDVCEAVLATLPAPRHQPAIDDYAREARVRSALEHEARSRLRRVNGAVEILVSRFRGSGAEAGEARAAPAWRVVLRGCCARIGRLRLLAAPNGVDLHGELARTRARLPEVVARHAERMARENARRAEAAVEEERAREREQRRLEEEEEKELGYSPSALQRLNAAHAGQPAPAGGSPAGQGPGTRREGGSGGGLVRALQARMETAARAAEAEEEAAQDGGACAAAVTLAAAVCARFAPRATAERALAAAHAALAELACALLRPPRGPEVAQPAFRRLQRHARAAAVLAADAEWAAALMPVLDDASPDLAAHVAALLLPALLALPAREAATARAGLARVEPLCHALAAARPTLCAAAFSAATEPSEAEREVMAQEAAARARRAAWRRRRERRRHRERREAERALAVRMRLHGRSPPAHGDAASTGRVSGGSPSPSDTEDDDNDDGADVAGRGNTRGAPLPANGAADPADNLAGDSEDTGSESSGSEGDAPDDALVEVEERLAGTVGVAGWVHVALDAAFRRQREVVEAARDAALRGAGEDVADAWRRRAAARADVARNERLSLPPSAHERWVRLTVALDDVDALRTLLGVPADAKGGYGSPGGSE